MILLAMKPDTGKRTAETRGPWLLQAPRGKQLFNVRVCVGGLLLAPRGKQLFNVFVCVCGGVGWGRER
jgi:hypothetical protein